MASVIPKQLKYEFITSMKNEAWKVALLDATYVYDSATDVLYTDANVIGHELAAVGNYSTGGANMLAASKTANYDGTSAYLDASDTQWTSATFTARYAVCYETTGSKIRAIFDLGSNTVTGGTFTIQWNSGGLIKIS